MCVCVCVCVCVERWMCLMGDGDGDGDGEAWVVLMFLYAEGLDSAPDSHLYSHLHRCSKILHYPISGVCWAGGSLSNHHITAKDLAPPRRFTLLYFGYGYTVVAYRSCHIMDSSCVCGSRDSMHFPFHSIKLRNPFVHPSIHPQTCFCQPPSSLHPSHPVPPHLTNPSHSHSHSPPPSPARSRSAGPRSPDTGTRVRLAVAKVGVSHQSGR